LELLGLTEVKIFEIGNVFTKGDEHTSLAFSSVNSEEIKKKISESIGFDIDFKTDGNIHEADFDEILKKLPEPKDSFRYSGNDSIHFKSFSQYPFVLRDIALWVPNNDEVKPKLAKIFDNQGGDLFQASTLFDQFQKGDQTSLAFHLVFQSFEKTLTDIEVNKIMDKIAEDINKQGWQVR
jgi:phenylalanyl-tRNA synthetase beta subunit